MDAPRLVEHIEADTQWVELEDAAGEAQGETDKVVTVIIVDEGWEESGIEGGRTPSNRELTGPPSYTPMRPSPTGPPRLRTLRPNQAGT